MSWSRRAIVDGDRFFDTYNDKLHRSVLPEGTVAKSLNKRFWDDRAVQRKGTVLPPFNSFWFYPDNRLKFLGSFVYTVPNTGQEILILVPSTANTGTVSIQAYDITNNRYFTIGLPIIPGSNPPTQITIGPNSIVWFAQGFGQLIMLISDRWTGGHNINHLTNGIFWNGDPNTPFQWFSWNNLSTTQVIPPSLYAWPVSDRMVYAWNFLPPNDNPAFSQSGVVLDHLLLSDIWGAFEQNPYQNMDPVLQDFTINSGSNDVIIGVIPFAFDSLIIFMKKSINSLTNFSADPTQAYLQVLTQYTGCVGPRAMLQIGSEVYFWGERKGLFKLSEVLDQRIVAEPLPVSDDIFRVIQRINWVAAPSIVMVATDDYLFSAVPLDGSLVNNAILVRNLTTNKWETIDTFPNTPHFRIDNFLIVHINGERRVLAVQNGPPALVYLMYEGNLDQTVFDPINPRYTAILDSIETRGYGLKLADDPNAWKNFRRGNATIETQNPNVQITGITEGVSEVKVLRPSITKDPTKFYVHGEADFTGGQNGLAEKRQDYSIGIQQPTIPQNFDYQDFENLPPGDILNLNQLIPVNSSKGGQLPQQTAAAIPLQSSTEPFAIRMTDRWISLGIYNTQGQCTVVATSVEAKERRKSSRVKA